MFKSIACAAAVLVGLTMSGFSAQAEQPATTPPSHRDAAGARPGTELFEKLGLTAEQKASIKTILTAAHEKAKIATDKQAKLTIIKEAFEKIKTDVLTAEQRVKFDELKPALGEKLKERRKEQGTKPANAP